MGNVVIARFFGGGEQSNLSSLKGVGAGNEPFRAAVKSFIKSGFTLAEVLITLGIIGVVAAMTLPSLVNNYKKQQVITSLQKTYSVLNQAFRMSQAENESYEYWEEAYKMGPGEYFDKYWKPYFKISRSCNSYKECGYPAYTPWLLANGQASTLAVVVPSLRTTFFTPDGVLIAISAFTGSTDLDDGGAIDNSIYVDVNGSKRPNQYGKDMFVFVRTKKGIMPYGYSKDEDTIDEDCSSKGTGYRCAAKLAKDGWQMKDDYPW